MVSGKVNICTLAYIDLDALEFNFLKIRRFLKPSVKMLVTVKQDAYGHGIVEVSRLLEKKGVDFLGIASLEEAEILRKNDIKVPILNLGIISFKEEAEQVMKLNVIQTVSSSRCLELLGKVASCYKRSIPIHLKIDTGMTRLGAPANLVPHLVKILKKFPYLKLEGIFTHFPSADTDRDFTIYQLQLFKKVLDYLKSQHIFPTYIHTSNSAALLKYPQTHFNLVRPGLIIYGANPFSFESLKGFKPVMSVKSRVIYVRTVQKGTSVSYGRTFISPKKMKIATIPIGYGNGLPFSLSNKGKVIIKGDMFPVVGRVCMDFIMVGAPFNKEIKVGDEVIIMGKYKNLKIGCEDIALLSGSIPYEILCRFGKGLKRIYIRGEKRYLEPPRV